MNHDGYDTRPSRKSIIVRKDNSYQCIYVPDQTQLRQVKVGERDTQVNKDLRERYQVVRPSLDIPPIVHHLSVHHLHPHPLPPFWRRLHLSCHFFAVCIIRSTLLDKLILNCNNAKCLTAIVTDPMKGKEKKDGDSYFGGKHDKPPKINSPNKGDALVFSFFGTYG